MGKYEAPERVWMLDGYGGWRFATVDRQGCHSRDDTEYIRADLHAALLAENEKLRARVAKLEASVEIGPDGETEVDECWRQVAELRRQRDALRKLALNWMSSARSARGHIFGPNDKVDYEAAKRAIEEAGD